MKKLCFKIPRYLDPGKGNYIPDVAHTGGKLERSLKTRAKPGKGNRPILNYKNILFFFSNFYTLELKIFAYES